MIAKVISDDKLNTIRIVFMDFCCNRLNCVVNILLFIVTSIYVSKCTVNKGKMEEYEKIFGI